MDEFDSALHGIYDFLKMMFEIAFDIIKLFVKGFIQAFSGLFKKRY